MPNLDYPGVVCPDMTHVRDVAVVGAGVLGLAAGRAIAARGRDVVVLEQAHIGHDGAGSKGSCRIFRLGYPEASYVRSAIQARELWLALESESGLKILHPTPHLTFGAGLESVRAAMQEAGAPCEVLTAQEAAAKFPAIRAGGPALLEPESCVTAADQALAALARGIPDIRPGVRVTGISDDGRQVTLRTSTGNIVARVAVVTAGPWSSGLLSSAGVPVPSRPTLEHVAYLRPRPDSAAAGPRSSLRTPIFICHDERSPYGLPVPGSDLYKIGIHPSGPTVDPDAQQSASAIPELADELADVARQLLPDYDPAPASTERCIYDNSPDEDFILDRTGNVVVGSGTSGHGFKFGPLFGEWLATLATGLPGVAPDERFALARFARPLRAG